MLQGRRKKGAGGGGEDSGGGGRVKVYLHAVTNDEAALLSDTGNTSPLQEVKKQSRASEVRFDLSQSSVTSMKIITIRGNLKQIEKAVSLISQEIGSQETISDQAQTFWLQWVQDAFPDLDSRAYFLPPVYFNRVPMTRQSVGGLGVLVLNTERGLSCESKELTPHKGVGWSREHELPRDARQSIQPTLPEHEYQDTEPTLPGHTSQCIQPISTEQPCNSNQTTLPGHLSHVNQLIPDPMAGYSNRMTPPEQAGQLPSPEQANYYIQAASQRQAGQCIQLNPSRQVSHYSETSHIQNCQFIQTPSGQAGQTAQLQQTGLYNQLTQPRQADGYIQTMPLGHTGQHNQFTQPGYKGQHIEVALPLHTNQYKQTPLNVQAGQYHQTTPTGGTGQYIHLPPGQDGQGIQSQPPGQTMISVRCIHCKKETPFRLSSQYTPTLLGPGQYIRLPTAQAGQYIETTSPGQAGQFMQPTPLCEAYQYSQTNLLGQAGIYMHLSALRKSYQQSQTIQSGLESQFMQTTPHRQADQDVQTPPTLTGQSDIQKPAEPTGQNIQTKAHGQADECIFPTPHEQASQRIELEAASFAVVSPSVHQPRNVLESDVRDDAAKQRVLVCLQEFFERNKEVLVGMSQLHFGQYLGEPVYAAATAQLPRPQNIPKTSSKTTQGSYDVLLIHRHYGFVVCEVRAFGDLANKISMSKEEIDNNIRKKLRDAVLQLDKAEVMLSHLVSDVCPGLRITKTIALPNLRADQVQQAIADDIPLIEDLCRCLGTTTDPADITSLCLCCDQLSEPKTPCDVSSHVLRELGHWWQRRVAGAGPDPHMTDVIYKVLVARFCGPATTVSVPWISPPRLVVKTLGQAVSYTGECYTAVITLFPEQADLLNRAPLRAFVAGPPGTGKTVVLMMMGIEWLRCGHHVYIVSTCSESRAACNMLYHLLLQTIKKQLALEVLPSQLHLLQLNLNSNENVKKAVNDLSHAASGGSLYVLSDEMGHEDTFLFSYPEMKHIKTFCKKLLSQVPRLHLWAASCYHEISPPGWQVEYLTRPLRSPPAVVREVKNDTTITKSHIIKPYSERGVPDHTDGPPVRRLRHRGQGHSGRWPGACVTCGREVASFLHSLRVGVTENNELTTLNTVTSTTSTTGSTTPPCLQWRDVLVLYWDDGSDNSGMVEGLEEAGIQVRVMKDDDIEDVATARSDVVWVASGRRVRGLERKVVACLLSAPWLPYDDLPKSDVSRDLALFRTASFHCISRCTSQLVTVC